MGRKERDEYQIDFTPIVDSVGLSEALVLHYRTTTFRALLKCVSTNAAEPSEALCNFSVVPTFELQVDWTGKKCWDYNVTTHEFACHMSVPAISSVQQFTSTNYNIHASCNERNSVWHDGSAYNITVSVCCEYNMCTHYYITQSTNIGAAPPSGAGLLAHRSPFTCCDIITVIHNVCYSAAAILSLSLKCVPPYNVFIFHNFFCAPSNSNVFLHNFFFRRHFDILLYLSSVRAGMRNVIIADKQKKKIHIPFVCMMYDVSGMWQWITHFRFAVEQMDKQNFRCDGEKLVVGRVRAIWFIQCVQLKIALPKRSQRSQLVNCGTLTDECSIRMDYAQITYSWHPIFLIGECFCHTKWFRHTWFRYANWTHSNLLIFNWIEPQHKLNEKSASISSADAFIWSMDRWSEVRSAYCFQLNFCCESTVVR